MIKTEHTGIYVLDEIPSNKGTRGTYKFVIRQTVTVAGIGKKTVKESFTVRGMSYNKALEKARDERPAMRERAIKKVRGISDDEIKSKALQSLTLDDVWEDYVTHKTKTSAKLWSKSNARTTKSLYKTHIAPVIGKKIALQVGYKDVEKCLLKIREKGISARMEKGVISALRPMFDWWYIREGLIDTKTNPATKQETRETPSRKVNLTWEQIEKLFKVMYSFENERYRQVWIWISTGRRINEVLSLTHDDIDSEGYYTIKAENNKVRKPMMYKVPLGVTLPLYKGFIHTSPRSRDKQLTDVTVNAQWQVVKALAKLPNFNKHDIRHIIETVLTDSEVPQQTINMVLGHLEAGASKHYKNDTHATADRKHRAVTFFLDKVFNRIDRKMLWDDYISSKST